MVVTAQTRADDERMLEILAAARVLSLKGAARRCGVSPATVSYTRTNVMRADIAASRLENESAIRAAYGLGAL